MRSLSLLSYIHCCMGQSCLSSFLPLGIFSRTVFIRYIPYLYINMIYDEIFNIARPSTTTTPSFFAFFFFSFFPFLHSFCRGLCCRRACRIICPFVGMFDYWQIVFRLWRAKEKKNIIINITKLIGWQRCLPCYSFSYLDNNRMESFSRMNGSNARTCVFFSLSSLLSDIFVFSPFIIVYWSHNRRLKMAPQYIGHVELHISLPFSSPSLQTDKCDTLSL